ncbi:MAG: GAF domain-containing protein, partial [Methylobacter sp.]
MAPPNNLYRFSRSLWLTLGMFVGFAVLFVVYVRSEKQIDRANEQRFQSYLLADELRQSSDDLTRMVRSYVSTGKPIYKQHYQEILDIRDGKIARPVDYQNIYWDLVLADDQRPRPDSGQKIAILEMMRQAGFTKEEFAKLAKAKANSDELSNVEFAAMKLIESTAAPTDANRIKASQILLDEDYLQAKADIMRPISEFYQLMNQRTLAAVHIAENTAVLLRIAFISSGLLLLLMLWRAYRTLHAILGSSVDELYERIICLGQGNFASAIPVAQGMENSVLGWLSETQINLARNDAQRQEAEGRNERMTQLYAALSQCNQAIVRCSNEEELFAQICCDAVTFGGMKMSWIGMLDEQKQLKPVASYGSGTEYLEGLQISVDENEATGQGPTGTAIREDRPFWCQDFQHDPITGPWHERGAKFGWGASAALPLHRNGAVVGVFTLYSVELNAFDQAARNLLVEMAMDID